MCYHSNPEQHSANTGKTTTMQVSFYCNHCRKHLRSGDHSECRKALRAQRKAPTEATRLSIGKRTQAKYQTGQLGDVLAKKDKTE
jgi:hypothetical protein